MVKIFIQIPVYNEEGTICQVLEDIPKSILGLRPEILIINDASIDSTLSIVRSWGVSHIVNRSVHTGLGEVFKNGLSYALENGADIVINTDGDGQYPGEEINKIVEPILKGEAEVVIGNRQVQSISNYPFYKKISQTIANILVSQTLKGEFSDVTSGFRAFSSKAAAILVKELSNPYTYTLESLSILSSHNISIAYVPIKINYPTRNSRLITSKWKYLKNFANTFVKILTKK